MGPRMSVVTLAICLVWRWPGGDGANLPDNILNEPDWGFQSQLDKAFTLTCNHSSLVPMTGNAVQWHLPSGVTAANGAKYELKSSDGVTNMELKVNDVQEADAGVYVCHVFESIVGGTKRGHLLRGLNLGGPEFEPVFEKYRHNLIVAGVAALVFFVPLVTICLVYKFRFQTSEEKREKHERRADVKARQRYLDALGADGKSGLDNGGAEMDVVAEGAKVNKAFQVEAGPVNTRL